MQMQKQMQKSSWEHSFVKLSTFQSSERCPPNVRENSVESGGFPSSRKLMHFSPAGAREPVECSGFCRHFCHNADRRGGRAVHFDMVTALVRS